MATSNILNNKFLKTLEPLSTLSIDKLTELANKSTVENLPAGRTLFRQGEKDKRSYYLISGQIELLTTGDAKPTIIKAKTPEAKYPIVQQSPRPSTAKTKVNCEILSIDASLLEMLVELDDNPSGHYEVTEIDSDDENGWMLKFLQSRAFLQIPTENIQKILMSMTEVSTKEGETIVSQGQSNDFYYIVKKGKCSVCRRPSPNAEDVQIAILAAGDGFGEEALITDGVRNATVKMLEDGVLMRLSKEDFISLLVTPLLDYIHIDELKSRASAGDLLVDVRQHKDFMNGHLDGAVNTPLSMIRLKLNTFNTERSVIVYCNDASKSTAAAFLLIQNGITCSILKDGVNKSQTESISNQSTTSMTNIIADLDAVTNKDKNTNKDKDKAPVKVSALPISQKTKSKKIKKQIDDLNKENIKQAEAKKLETEKAKAHKLALKEAKEKLELQAAQKKKAEEEKIRLEKEKLRLEKETQALRDKAEAEKRAAEEELKKLTTESIKHKEAIKEKKIAEENALALRKKAEAEKLAAEAKLKQQAEEAQKQKQIIAEKQQAERDALALRERAEKEKLAAKRELEEHKKQLAEQQKLTEESNKKLLQESEQIRQQADRELAQLREELQKTRSSVEDRVKALKEKERLQAEEEIRHRQQHANDAIKESIEKARQQAAEEADKVRQQALIEAQNLQKEIEVKKQILETEAKKIRLEAERDRATTLELARKQAQEIVTKTTEEASYIKNQRKELDQEAEKIRLLAEAERQATLNAAREEAHDIVRKTAEEAQQLDLHRQRIESEVSKIKTHAEQEKLLTLEAANKEAERIRNEAEEASRLQAQQKVEQLKNKTLQQAQALNKQREQMENSLKEAENIRLLAEKEAEKIRLEALQNSTDIEEIEVTSLPGHSSDEEISLSDISLPGGLTEQPDAPTMVESEAKNLAQEIVSKLEKAESNRIKDQSSSTGNSGLSLASASLKRRSDGQIILEGEEDIFIFKEPKSYSEQELNNFKESLYSNKVEKPNVFIANETPASEVNNSTELPEFTIDEPEFDLVDELPSHLSSKQNSISPEFSDFELLQPTDIRASKTNSKRPAQKYMAIAASLFVVIGVGITFLGVKSEKTTSTDIAIQDSDSFNATRVSGIATNNIDIDKKVMTEAELEFEKLLNKWKRSKNAQLDKK